MTQSSPKQSNYRKFQKGDRVVLQDGREATVKFEGSVLFTGGYFVGLALDQPSGKHDGRINGRRYFHCPKGHGLFVRPISIQTILNPSHNNQWRVRSNNNNNNKQNNNRNNRNNRSNHHNQHYYNSNNTHNCNKYRNNNKQNNNDYNANLSHSPNQLQRNTMNACNTSIAANITNPNSFNPSNHIPNHSNPMNSMPPMGQIIHQTADINKIGLTLPVHVQNTAPSNINNININKNIMTTQPHLPQPPLQQQQRLPPPLPLPPPPQQQQQQIRPPPLQQQQQQQQQQLRPPPLQQQQQLQQQLPNTNININTINANASPYQVHTALINPSALISAFPLTHQNISLYNSIPNHLYNIFTRSTPNSLYSSQLPPYPASTVSCLSYQGVLGGLRFDPNTTNIYATNPNIANANANANANSNQYKKNCNTIVINELPVLTPKHCPKTMAFPRDKQLATALSAHSDNAQKHKELELQHKTPEPQHIQHIEQMQEIEEIEEIEEEERERDRESVSFFKWANFDDAEDIKDDNDYFALKLERRRSYPFVESELHLGKLLRSRSRVNDKLRQEKRSLKTKIDEVQNVSTELWSKNAALQSKNKEYLAKLCCIKNKIKNILDYQSNKELAMLFDNYLKDVHVHNDNNNNMANEDADIAESAITDCSPSSTIKTRDHESIVSCTERERERDHLPLNSVNTINTLKDKGLSHVDEDCVTAQSIIANNTVLTPYHHNKYLNRLNFNNKIINDRKTGAKLQKRRLNMWNNLKYNRINENSTINNELNESEIRAQGSAAYHNIRSVESPSSDSSVSTRKSAVFASIPELEHNI